MSWSNSNGCNDPSPSGWNSRHHHHQQQQQQQQQWNAQPSRDQPTAWSILPPQHLQQHKVLHVHQEQVQGFHAMQQPPYPSLPPLQSQLTLPQQPQFLQQPQFTQPVLYFHPPHNVYSSNNRPPLPPPPPPPPPRAQQQQQQDEEDMEESEDEELSQKSTSTSPIPQGSAVNDLPLEKNVIDLVADSTTGNYNDTDETGDTTFGDLYDDVVVLKVQNNNCMLKADISQHDEQQMIQTDTEENAIQQQQQQKQDWEPRSCQKTLVTPDDNNDMSLNGGDKPLVQGGSSVGDRQSIKQALEEAKQDLQQCQNLSTSDRREALLRAKARLEEARAMRRLATAATATAPSSLPPVSALQTSLVIQNINGPKELVRFQHDDNAKDDFEAIRQEVTAEIIRSPPSHKKRKILQQNLLSLKKKLLVLKKTKSKRIRLEEEAQQAEEEEDDEEKVQEKKEAVVNQETTVVQETKKASMEDLKKRQERLQVTMGIMYWKKLVAKQTNLLEEQNSKVMEIEDQLRSNQECMVEQEKKLQECDEMIARFPILETMIANVTCQLLTTRRALHETMKD